MIDFFIQIAIPLISMGCHLSTMSWIENILLSKKITAEPLDLRTNNHQSNGDTRQYELVNRRGWADRRAIVAEDQPIVRVKSQRWQSALKDPERSLMSRRTSSPLANPALKYCAASKRLS